MKGGGAWVGRAFAGRVGGRAGMQSRKCSRWNCRKEGEGSAKGGGLVGQARPTSDHGQGVLEAHERGGDEAQPGVDLCSARRGRAGHGGQCSWYYSTKERWRAAAG